MDYLRRFFLQDKAANPNKSVHGAYLAILLVFLLLPFFLKVESEGGKTTIFGTGIPSTCVSQSVFGASCPGCGMTRSFVQLCHGSLVESLRQHRVGILLYAFFLAQVVYRIFCLMNPGRTFYPWVVNLQFYLPLFVLAAIAVNWIWGVVSGSGNGIVGN